jgi:hypothetical protein
MAGSSPPKPRVSNMTGEVGVVIVKPLRQLISLSRVRVVLVVVTGLRNYSVLSQIGFVKPTT